MLFPNDYKSFTVPETRVFRATGNEDMVACAVPD